MAEKDGSVIAKGHEEGTKLATSIMNEFGLPPGLLLLVDVIQVTFVRRTGYMRILQRKKVEHKFEMIGKSVSYDTEIKGYLLNKKIKKLKGVKAKEVMLWPPVYEIRVDEASTGNIHFKGFAGIIKTFPVEAFAIAH